jgi:mutator protein MutT
MVKNRCKKEIKFTVYTIVKCKNEILLLHRTEDLNVWEFPGGKIEFGESPYETALRELKEEVGIENKNIKLFDVTRGESNKNRRWIYERVLRFYNL